MYHLGMSTSHIVHLKIIHMMENGHASITYTRDGKITDTAIMQHHFNHCIQIVISDTFTAGFGFVTPIHVSVQIMSFTHITLVKIIQNHHKMVGPQLLRTNSLASVMGEKTILQAALTNRNVPWYKKTNSKLGQKLSKCGTNFRSKCNTHSFF